MAVVAVDGGDELRSGCARERARGREGEQRVRERREVQGGRGGVRGSLGCLQRRAGKQEVAEAASARATPRLCSSSWQRRKRTRGRRWAGPAGPVGGAR